MMQRALLLLSLAAPAAAVFAPQRKADLINAVTTCLTESLFGDCTELAEETLVRAGQGEGYYGAIGEWDVSAITSMKDLFKDIHTFNQDLSSWDVSLVTNMESMFTGATSFNQDLSPWDVSKVTNMRYMFANAEDFTHQPCGCAWVASQADQHDMFAGAGEGSGIASQACYNFEYTNPSAAPQCYLEEAARQAIRPLIADYPDIVSEEWEAATASCGS